jgi:hypothetical protein
MTFLLSSTPAGRQSFPFGQAIVPLVQQDRTAKRVFVLGVYASAVHARWVDTAGKTLINALAVASEPEIFWRGEGAADLVQAITRTLPDGAGSLIAADSRLNGPSGRTLGDDFLKPLGVARAECWLCDLLPESRQNKQQEQALQREYVPRMVEWGLPAYNFPPVPTDLADDSRREAIMAEVLSAKPDVLITLGDMPLRWFTRPFGSKTRLSSYGDTPSTYGRLYDITIAGHVHRLLPLVHPRQAGALGLHSQKWSSLHQGWKEEVAPGLIVNGTAGRS